MKRTITTKTISMDTEYLEFFSQPQYKRITSFLVRGYEDAGGVFHEVEREAVTIEGQDYEDLMASNANGKMEGHFRNDDVLAATDNLKG